MRHPLVQQDRGFCGPNHLGRRHPRLAASGVPPNRQSAHLLDQQHRRPLRSHRRRRAGGGSCHRHRFAPGSQVPQGRPRLWWQLLPERHPHLVYLCGHYGLHEVAATWQQVVALNNTWQQHRISPLVVRLFGTVTGKRIAVLGFAYGLRPTASTKPTPTTPARPRRSASAATCWRKARSWRSLIPR